jgi:glycerol-3-phosphate dehydrogenase (NAD(P)+)
MQNILVLGSGNYGTCLALHLSRLGHNVALWTRNEIIYQSVNKDHKNPKYLSDFDLPANLVAIKSLSPSLIKTYDTLIIALPTQSIRSVLNQIKSLSHDQLLICVSKGIEIGTEKVPHEIIYDIFGQNISDQCVILSGPSFAREIAEKEPTGVAVASLSPDRCLAAQSLFHDPFFRVYTGHDPIGLEIAGALKNVIAIASGAASGLGYKNNTRATLITRGLAEITRIGMAKGANPLTFKGLGGVGDLFLTCTSEESRNYSLGFYLGKGKPVQTILQELHSTAEGFYTAQSAYTLASQLGVEAPIIDEVYQVLYKSKPIKDAVLSLLTRDAKPELTLN